MLQNNSESDGALVAAFRSHAAGASRSRSRRHQAYLWAGAVLFFMLLLCHLTLFSRATQLGSLVCRQRLPDAVDLQQVLSLQHLKSQRASLQSDLARRMNMEQLELTAGSSVEAKITRRDTAHASTLPLALFVGIVSHSSEDRMSVRQGWISKADYLPGWKAKFVVCASSLTAAKQEQGQYGDLLLTKDGSSLHQTLFMMQYALFHFDVQFIMKTEDTSYLRVENLLQVLQASCTNPACHGEGLYMGHEIKNSSVLKGADDVMPQSSQQYLEHTHLKTHMPYMSGAGYILSSDLGHAVIDIASRSETHDWLFESGRDDMSIGFWLMSLDIRRVNHSGVITSNQDRGMHEQQGKPSQDLDKDLALTSITRYAQMRSRTKSLVDVCQQSVILLSPIQGGQAVAQVEESLQQCQRLDKLRNVAIDIEYRHAAPRRPLLPHGKVRRLSHGSQQDQFSMGSYSTTPWSVTGTMMLALKPKAQNNKLSIGLLKASNTAADDTWYWEHLDTSWAWNSHQGPQLQWLGPSDRYIVFNDGRCHGIQLSRDPFCAVVFDIQHLTRARILPLPIHTVSPNGYQGLHVSFVRQELATPACYAGKGYKSHSHTSQSSLNTSAPYTDGLWLVDMFSGHSRMLLSLGALLNMTAAPSTSAHESQPSVTQEEPACFHWFSKPQFNRDASRLAFLHNASNCSTDTTSLQAQDTFSSSVHNSVSLVTMDVTGKGVWVLPLKDVVHYEYGRGGKLIVSTQHGLFEADALGHSIQELMPPTIASWSSLSHCSYHQHSERFILTVTAGPQQKEIAVWDRWSNHVHSVGLYSARRDRSSFLHNELHPMWAPDGCTLAFDSTHTGQGWQVFVAGVSGLKVDMVRSMAMLQLTSGQHHVKPSKQQGQHMLLDLGSGSGLSIKNYLHANQARQHDIQVHAFEPDTWKVAQLRKFLTDSKLHKQPIVHDTAVWIANDQVSMTSFVANSQHRNVRPTLYRRISDTLWALAGHSRDEMNAHPAKTRHGNHQAIPGQNFVQTVDFSRWLVQNVGEGDYIAVQMNIAGAEFHVIEKLISDGSILLIDDLYIVWHEELGPAFGKWREGLESLATKLGIQCHSDRQNLQLHMQ
ncbi:TPA: hypothetical protein ACH3X1_004849 [Trebouxia sp. C0004]